MSLTRNLIILKGQIKAAKTRIEELKQMKETLVVKSEIKKEIELLRVLNNHLRNA